MARINRAMTTFVCSYLPLPQPTPLDRTAAGQARGRRSREDWRPLYAHSNEPSKRLANACRRMRRSGRPGERCRRRRIRRFRSHRTQPSTHHLEKHRSGHLNSSPKSHRQTPSARPFQKHRAGLRARLSNRLRFRLRQARFTGDKCVLIPGGQRAEILM